MILAKTFDVAKIQKTQPKALAFIRLNESEQPICYQNVLARQLQLVAISGFTDAQANTDKANADAIACCAISLH